MLTHWRPHLSKYFAMHPPTTAKRCWFWIAKVLIVSIHTALVCMAREGGEWGRGRTFISALSCSPRLINIEQATEVQQLVVQHFVCVLIRHLPLFTALCETAWTETSLAVDTHLTCAVPAEVTGQPCIVVFGYREADLLFYLRDDGGDSKSSATGGVGTDDAVWVAPWEAGEVE